MRIQQKPIVSAPYSGPSRLHSDAPPPDALPALERDSVSQHAGNIGFGISSALSLLKVGARMPLVSKFVPGLNLGVAALEGYNAHKTHAKGDNMAAAIHLGNSISCLSGFLEESGALALTKNNSGLGAGLALAGGGLGLGVGIWEMHHSLKLEAPVDARKMMVLGAIDAASGLACLAAGVMTCAGVGGNLGVALFAASSAFDLTNLGVDYLGHKIPGIRARD